MKAIVRLALAVIPALVACSREAGQGAQSFEVTKGSSTPNGRLAPNDLRLTTAHAGVRRIEFAPGAGPGFSYREEIVTDGQGNYSIRPLDSDSSTLDWGTFELMQVLREGFLFRYRDLIVRNARLLSRNWEITDLAQTTQVAGRSCRHLRVVRKVGEPIAYELAIDRETDLVLADRRFDAAGNELASMRYESFRLDPDLSQVAWHQPANDEQPLALRDLDQQLGQRVLEPRLLPDGFLLYEAATVSEGESRWLKLTYTDGLEPLFFFQRLPLPMTPGALAPEPNASKGAPPPESSRVTVYGIQHLTVAQGRCQGYDLIAMGALAESGLLDLIESSLP